jgi:hypothetical protein
MKKKLLVASALAVGVGLILLTVGWRLGGFETFTFWF